MKGRVSLYVVYDGRKGFSSEAHGSDVIHDKNWGCCGNYKICKIDAKMKGQYREFRFFAEGRMDYWLHWDGLRQTFVKENQITLVMYNDNK